ncbi:hypothetical protein SAMN04515671_1370 [Nakamurella panacisegetis]|uniref:Uncharacterized protein n=1 Tax=Nakamurella panacisegetis TaxID=1090615 RepID=A0A1H0KMV0_9ACTN|nr:hypothetical protein SAMN04515671_1370 [Nakamurella panacisegetis]
MLSAEVPVERVEPLTVARPLLLMDWTGNNYPVTNTNNGCGPPASISIDRDVVALFG